MRWVVLSGFALLADQITKDVAVCAGGAGMMDTGWILLLFVGAIVALVAAAIFWRSISVGALAATAGAALILDVLLHGALVLPWTYGSAGINVGLLCFILGGVMLIPAVIRYRQGGIMMRESSKSAVSNAPRGMTLIEILVVIAIIGIVATVVAVGVIGYLKDAKVMTTKTLVDNVAKGATTYAITHHRLPKDLNELVDAKYIKKNQTRDPWDNDLDYNEGSGSDIDDFTLCSSGPDGSPGSDDDICHGQDDE
jgi:general secretion pathway protein G